MRVSGTRLGPYEILSRIGAGGMGEVWRARDTRLDRQVAIKVLPPALANNEQFRARFEREAKTISQLNHPNICTLHDVGHESGMSYLVMELLEGESLADRLAKGPLSRSEVLKCGTQIAAALDRAHRAGVVHRDLKPGNVVITKTGAKLLDFGLAKSSPPSAAVSVDGDTEHKPLTQEGTMVGTFQYMAPEQLEGEDADERTDIFTFGVLLYEMATGRRAFAGKTRTSLIAAIISSQPEPISSIDRMSPPALDHVVRKCMEKDPEDRWQSAHDVMTELQWIAEGGSQVGMPAAARPGIRSWFGWVAAALFAVVAVVSVLAARSGSDHEPLAFRQLNFRREAIFQAAFAPGGAVVYSAAVEGNTPQMFTVRPDYPEPQAVGRPGMHLLAVSSKGELAVLIGARYVWHRLFIGTLARMPLSGGAPREVLEGVRQADWSPDGSQLAIIREVEGRDRLEYPIGHVLCEASGYMTDVRISPKGDRIAYFQHPRKWDDRGSVNIVDLAGKKTVLSEGYWSLRGLSWSADGEEILFSGSLGGGSYTIYAVCLRKTDGSPVIRLGDGWAADLSVDSKSVLAVVQSRPPQLVIYPTGAGETRRLERGDIENYATARWFPDGKTVLICGNEPGKGTRFYVQEIRGGLPRPVTPEGTREGWLSPDATLVLAKGSGGTYSLYPIEGGAPQPVPGLVEADVVAQWSSDGRSVLAYRRAEIPSRLERVDLDTGKRSLFKEIARADRTGLLSIRDIFVTDDLQSYAYTAYYQVSSLFVSDRKE